MQTKPVTTTKKARQRAGMGQVVRYRCDAPLIQSFDARVARAGKKRSQVLRELMERWVAKPERR